MDEKPLNQPLRAYDKNFDSEKILGKNMNGHSNLAYVFHYKDSHDILFLDVTGLSREHLIFPWENKKNTENNVSQQYFRNALLIQTKTWQFFKPPLPPLLNGTLKQYGNYTLTMFKLGGLSLGILTDRRLRSYFRYIRWTLRCLTTVLEITSKYS